MLYEAAVPGTIQKFCIVVGVMVHVRRKDKVADEARGYG